MMRRIFPGVLAVALMSFIEMSPSANASQVMDLDGAWFSCEFAHSRIAPEDGCEMLDDDGFLVVGNTIDQIKVRDSKETACRHNRTGNCFRRDQPGVVVKRDSTGTFRPTADGFQIKYWGCAQDYKMAARNGYFEVKPAGDLCFWTSDKRYFLARFTGNIEFASQESDTPDLSSRF